VVIGLVVILVIALYFGGVFDKKNAQDDSGSPHPPSKHPLDYTVGLKYKLKLSYPDKDKEGCEGLAPFQTGFLKNLQNYRVAYYNNNMNDMEAVFSGVIFDDSVTDFVDEWSVEKVEEKFVLYIHHIDGTKYYLTQKSQNDNLLSNTKFILAPESTNAYDFSPHITDDEGTLVSKNTEDSLQMCTHMDDTTAYCYLCTGSDIPKSPDDDNCSPLTVELVDTQTYFAN
jgi:hypothetical protein